MKVQVQKWGNSLALRIASSFAIETNISQGSTVDVTLRGDTIVLKPTRSELTLENLLELVTDENSHREHDSGLAVGIEVW